MTDDQEVRLVRALETIADHLAVLVTLITRVIEEPPDEDSDDWAIRTIKIR